MQSEIDAKKNDGRLGKRARTFNKLLDIYIETRQPVQILIQPRIDVALITNRRIDWDILDDLDRDDGDDRIVAQALHAIINEPARLVVLSHDMRPRDAAITHGLQAVKMPESWLRDPEPSPDQRRLVELEGKVRLLSIDQPELRVSIETASREPWQFLSVAEPTTDQIQSILERQFASAPRVSRPDRYDFGQMNYDSSHSDRLDTWRDGQRENIPLMHLGLTRLFAQQRIRVSVENVGSVSAEGLSLEVRSGNTVLHSIPYWVLISGPAAPRPRLFHSPLLNFSGRDFMPRQREQFTFYWEERGPGDHVILSCASFRQAKIYSVELSIELLATTFPRAQMEAVVTASNMKGNARSQLLPEVEKLQLPFENAYDITGGALRLRPKVDLPNDFEKDDFTWYVNNGTEYDA